MLPTDHRFSDDNADEQVALIERLLQAFFFSLFPVHLSSAMLEAEELKILTYLATYCDHSVKIETAKWQIFLAKNTILNYSGNYLTFFIALENV